MNATPPLPPATPERAGGGQPTRSHVLTVVVAGHAGSDANATVKALATQTLRPDHLVVVNAGTQSAAHLSDADLATIDGMPNNTVVQASNAHNLAQAVKTGLADPQVRPLVLQCQWIWILHDDAVPHARCLEELWRVADRGKTIAVVGPKQLEPEGEGLEEFGIIASRSARRLNTIAPGEIDQGQYDGRLDVLAVGTAGMLVRRDVWTKLGGLDPALGPFGDGLEFGRRVRRAGYRVVVAAHATIRHRRASFDVDGINPRALKRSLAQQWAARWYNWLVALPWFLVAPVMVWLLFSLPLRSLGFLVSGNHTQAGVPWRAWWWVFRRTPALLGSRHRARVQATLPRNTLKPLEATHADFWRHNRLNRHIRRAAMRMERQGNPMVAASLHRWRARSWGTFAVLMAAFVTISVVFWLPKLSGVAGASWAGAPVSWFDLFQHAFSAWVWAGDPISGMNDPLLMVLATITAPFALIGVAPTTALRLVLILGIPASLAAMWWCASRFTSSIPLRSAASVCWSLLPVALVGASQGRVGVIVFHVVAPLALGAGVSWWLRTGAGGGPIVAGPTGTVQPVKRRRLGAGAVALLCATLICTAPWLLGLLWLLCVVATAIYRPKGIRLWLISVPSAVLVAPFLVNAVTAGAWPVLATTGGPQLAAPAGDSWTLLGGLPSAATWIPTGGLALLLSATWGALWLFSVGLLMWGAIRGTRPVGALSAGVGGGAVFVAIAWGQHLLPVAAQDGVAVSADPSPALDAAALGLMIALVHALTSQHAWNAPEQRRVMPFAAVLTLAALVCGGTWAWLGPMNAISADHVHSASRQVPAVIANAQAGGELARLLVVESGDPWQISDWAGDGPMVTDASSMVRWQGLSESTPTPVQQALVTTLVTPDSAATQTLAAHHVQGILIPDPSVHTATVEAALDRAPGIERVGDTDQGRLWRVGQTKPLAATPVVYLQPWWVLPWQIAGGAVVALSVIFIFPRRRAS